MPARADRYDTPSIILHWLTFLLVGTLFAVGWYMTDLPKGSAERSYFFALHKSLGLTAAAVVLLRLAWRLRHAAPPLPESVRAWQRRAARTTQGLLYVLLVMQPLSGYLSSSFTRYGTRWWGIPLPQWGWADPALNELFTDVHVACSIALLSLIALHVCGAIFHLARADGVMQRMLPAAGDGGSGVAPSSG